MSDQAPDVNPNLNIRPDERQMLLECRRTAMASGVTASVIAWLAIRYLITSSPLSQTFIARNRGVTYSIGIGFAFYQGISSAWKRCFKGLATLENSAYGDFARKALEMYEDRKKLSRAEFVQKYPPDVQRKLFDKSHFFKPNSPTEVDPSFPPEQPAQQSDMFYQKQQLDDPNKTKSFRELQRENRSKGDHGFHPIRDHTAPKGQPASSQPAKQSDTLANLPPGPEGKSKVKRNQYGDVVYEE